MGREEGERWDAGREERREVVRWTGKKRSWMMERMRGTIVDRGEVCVGIKGRNQDSKQL